jgi:hypothetical protein
MTEQEAKTVWLFHAYPGEHVPVPDAVLDRARSILMADQKGWSRNFGDPSEWAHHAHSRLISDAKAIIERESKGVH